MRNPKVPDASPEPDPAAPEGGSPLPWVIGIVLVWGLVFGVALSVHATPPGVDRPFSLGTPFARS